MRIGIVTTTAAEAVQSEVTNAGIGDLSPWRALDALENILPKPTFTVKDCCQFLIDLILSGSTDAASTIQKILVKDYVHPSSIADDNISHLIWAVCYALISCTGGGGEMQTDAFIAILAMLLQSWTDMS